VARAADAAPGGAELIARWRAGASAAVAGGIAGYRRLCS